MFLPWIYRRADEDISVTLANWHRDIALPGKFIIWTTSTVHGSLDSLDAIIKLPQRKLVAARNEVRLNSDSPNEIYVLMVEESRGSAGGRAASSGHRKINRIYGFRCAGNKTEQFFDSTDESEIERFEIPYSAVAMDILLSDGAPYVVQGVIDGQFIEAYNSIVNKSG